MDTRQPNSRYCFVCGVSNPIGLHLHFDQTAPGEITVEIKLPEQYQGYPGIVHGGIIAAMLDEVAGRVHMGSADQPRFMFTARLDVRYRKNVPTETPLRVVGTAGESKGRMAEAKAAIYNMDGELLADASAVLVDVPDRIMKDVNLESVGWRIYPEDQIGAPAAPVPGM